MTYNVFGGTLSLTQSINPFPVRTKSGCPIGPNTVCILVLFRSDVTRDFSERVCFQCTRTALLNAR